MRSRAVRRPGGRGRRAGLASLLAAAWAGVACQTPPAAFPAGPMVDLTHAFDAQTIYWPTDLSGFVLEELAAGQTEQGYYYAANRFSAAEHGGTHLDAPLHFAQGRAAVDEIPLSRLLGPGVVVDVAAKAARDPDYQVTRLDFAAWEERHGPLPQGAIVLLYTGYGSRWGDRGRYLGTERTGPEAVAELHFPGLHPDAARWLATERVVGAVGLDTASIDFGRSELFESHRILFEHGIPALENLARLDALPPTRFAVVALPMKIRGGSGAPLRAIAILP